MVAIQTLTLFTVKETYGPVLLRRKAQRLAKETGQPTRSKFQVKRQTPADFARSIFRPFFLFVQEPILQALCLVQCFMFGLTFLIMVTVGSAFINTYGWRPSIAGLTYIPLGCGFATMTWFQGVGIDRLYQHFINKYGVEKPEYRL